MNRRAAMRIPFGRYKGELLEDLPFAYLEWLNEQDFLREPLKSAIKAEFERRTFSQERRIHIHNIDMDLIDDIVEAGRRSLAKIFHPDAGGSNHMMQQVNAACDWLKQQARLLT